MKPRPYARALTLAVHPTWAGFGWVAFESPLSPYDWNLVYTDKDKNASCLRRLEKLITRLDPGTLVLEAFERHALRTDRIQRLCRSLVSLAEARGIEVAVFTRDEVRSSFIEVGARTRVEIAEAVARSLEVLRHHLPPPRKRWDKEDARLALFSAAAVALTYYRLASTSILDQLR